MSTGINGKVETSSKFRSVEGLFIIKLNRAMHILANSHTIVVVEANQYRIPNQFTAYECIWQHKQKTYHSRLTKATALVNADFRVTETDDTFLAFG